MSKLPPIPVFDIVRIKEFPNFSTAEILKIANMFINYCKLDIQSISPIGKIAQRIAIGNQTYSCNKYRGSSPYSYVICRWFSDENEEPIFRPAIIKTIYGIEATDEAGISKLYWIAELDWFKEHPKKNHFGFNSHIKVWDSIYEPTNNSTFIPITFIKSRYVYQKELFDFGDYEDSVVLSINIPFQSFL